MEKEILWNLKCAETNLNDDIQSLAYLIEEWFEFSEPKDNFKYSYFEIQNRLNLISKSMIYNYQNMLKAVNQYYTKTKKEGD